MHKSFIDIKQCCTETGLQELLELIEFRRNLSQCVLYFKFCYNILTITIIFFIQEEKNEVIVNISITVLCSPILLASLKRVNILMSLLT